MRTEEPIRGPDRRAVHAFLTANLRSLPLEANLLLEVEGRHRFGRRRRWVVRLVQKRSGDCETSGEARLHLSGPFDPTSRDQCRRLLRALARALGEVAEARREGSVLSIWRTPAVQVTDGFRLPLLGFF